jgi:biopolymer transport protein ExbB/biopolymer transport protein TolQ
MGTQRLFQVSRLVILVLLGGLATSTIGITVAKTMDYYSARVQSREFAPRVAGALREGKLDEAIKIADRYKKSHLAKVVAAGLQELQTHHSSGGFSSEGIDACKRALDRAEVIVNTNWPTDYQIFQRRR